MDFTFARANRHRAVFAVFACSDEPERRDQRDSARFQRRGVPNCLANHYNSVMVAAVTPRLTARSVRSVASRGLGPRYTTGAICDAGIAFLSKMVSIVCRALRKLRVKFYNEIFDDVAILRSPRDASQFPQRGITA